jgi:hypothetical protein
MVYSRDWGKLIHEKNQKSKISWHCPFKPTAKLNQLLNYIFLPMAHNTEKNIHLQMHLRCPSPLQAKNKQSINMSFLLEKRCPNYALFTAEIKYNFFGPASSYTFISRSLYKCTWKSVVPTNKSNDVNNVTVFLHIYEGIITCDTTANSKGRRILVQNINNFLLKIRLQNERFIRLIPIELNFPTFFRIQEKQPT